jgi:hypothetical protein
LHDVKTLFVLEQVFGTGNILQCLFDNAAGRTDIHAHEAAVLPPMSE